MARLLVVEDDPDIQGLLVNRLARAGHAVATASSGEEALAMVEAAPPDLVLLDIELPGITGWDVLRRIGDGHGGRVRVLLVTVLEPSDAPPDVHPDGWLVKPFSGPELTAAVDEVLACGPP